MAIYNKQINSVHFCSVRAANSTSCVYTVLCSGGCTKANSISSRGSGLSGSIVIMSQFEGWLLHLTKNAKIVLWFIRSFTRGQCSDLSDSATVY